ncbi:MAG: basic secretory protein-like protein [Phaeodactylibacter sp.]|uniref:basic secretory protein-like protein n=1 Tax=Phaeodactylibacter sp. TaxID=1940289 RepID=UPI0032EDDC01
MKIQKTVILLAAVLCVQALPAQYFGRNKAKYETFDFEVYESPNFEIYHYLQNPERLREITEEAEQWYRIHQYVLKDTIRQRNPLIFYNDHADFQQTNAISGNIGVGTGGVTEALKNRVIMPFAMSHQQTHHVLGHELVHAFQYNMILNGDSTNLQSLRNLPLWMVEGMAEYLSIGSIDAHTAMWMRDAVLNDDVPSIKDLNNPKYFPYRYGQVFWAFLTGLRGDEIVEPFFKGVAMYGFDEACKRVLGMTQKDLSKLWVDGVKRHFGAAFDTTAVTDRVVGKELIGKENGGRMNVAPEISPNGRYVIFLSEKDLFSIDLFLADARTGEVIRKVASSTRAGHIDDFDYIESSGTWSANSREFAFVAFSKGRNILVIKDVETGKTVRELRPDGLQAFSNPDWSPDGMHFVVTGLVEGETDLYQVNARTGAVAPLTDDAYSELHPKWSEEGNTIVFSTDRLSRERGRTNGRWAFNLATLDMASGRSTDIDVFPGADNLNPVFDTTGNILFLSNRDGFRNIYRYEPGSQKVYQLTDLITGVSGITHYAPAISIARRRDRVLYTYFSQNGYRIYRARPIDFLNQEVDPDSVDFKAAQLPRFNKMVTSSVDRILQKLPAKATIADSALAHVPYKPKFELDYVGGSAGVGVGTSNTFGTQTGLAGGVDLLFSDILGDNQLYTSLALNGEITDFGGAVAYINRKRQLNWGMSVSHMPFRSFAYGGRGFESLEVEEDLFIPVVADSFYVRRIFEDKVSAFVSYPFSTTLRAEGSMAYARYSSRLDQYVNFYETDGTYVGRQLGQEREKLDSPEGFNLWNTGVAVVGDNAQGGLVGPLNGHRFRLGIDRYFGEFNYFQATADYRKYKYFDWFGLAFRAMHIGRYGQGANELFPYYAGSSWFIRGYSTSDAGAILSQNGRSIEELFGSKLGVANVEVRIPFTGPERLALIKSGLLFTELTLFADAAVAWYDFDQLSGATYRTDNEGNPLIGPTGEPIVDRYAAQPLMSVGASVRVNLFGAMVLEPYCAFPLQRKTQGTFGLNLIPAW